MKQIITEAAGNWKAPFWVGINIFRCFRIRSISPPSAASLWDKMALLLKIVINDVTSVKLNAWKPIQLFDEISGILHFVRMTLFLRNRTGTFGFPTLKTTSLSIGTSNPNFFFVTQGDRNTDVLNIIMPLVLDSISLQLSPKTRFLPLRCALIFHPILLPSGFPVSWSFANSGLFYLLLFFLAHWLSM